MFWFYSHARSWAHHPNKGLLDLNLRKFQYIEGHKTTDLNRIVLYCNMPKLQQHPKVCFR